MTYEPKYFLENYCVDYIISGEGEVVFDELLTALENKKEIHISVISNPNYNDENIILK